MRHLVILFTSLIAFVVSIYTLYRPLGRDIIPQIAPFFIEDNGIWGTIKLTSSKGEKRIIQTDILEDIIISKDEKGIPHISANNYQDALFALGYLTGKERKFQMELIQRYVAGESAEWFGDSHVEIDQFMLSLGLEHAAWTQLTKLKDKEEYDLLVAYSNGVNSFINNEFKKTSQLEYALLGLPSRYNRPVDAYRTLQFLHFIFNWKMDDFYYQKIIDEAGEGYLRDVFLNHLQEERSIEGETFPSMKNKPFLKKNDQSYINTLNWLEKKINFLEFTTGFKPSEFSSTTLISDENEEKNLAYSFHGPLVQPNFFFEVIIHLPNKTFHGYTVPGIPGLLFGASEELTWTLNPTSLDLIDFQVVDPNSIDKLDKNYSIKVKNGEVVRHQVQLTNNGVLFNVGSEFVNMNWTNKMDGLLAKSLKNAFESNDMISLFNSFSDSNIPVFQLTGFDDNGIGYFLTGKIPVRESYLGIRDNNSEPLFDSLLDKNLYYPSISNNLAFVNQYPLPEFSKDLPYINKNGFFKSQRVFDLFDDLNVLNTDNLIDILYDNQLPHQNLIPYFEKLYRGKINSPINTVGNNLIEWDYKSELDALYPKLFNNLNEVLNKLIYDEYSIRYYPNIDISLDVLVNKPNVGRFDIMNTIQKENGIDILEQSFETAFDLTVLESGSFENWSWSNSNTASIKHFSNYSLLNKLNSQNVIRDGNNESLNRTNQSIFPISNTLVFTVNIENESIWKTTSIMPLGNTSNRYSTFFENQYDFWISKNVYQNDLSIPNDSTNSTMKIIFQRK